MKISFWKKSKNNEDEVAILRSSVMGQGADTAYQKRAEEIESLRKYDRGEKNIIAPDIRNLVRNL